MKRAYRMYCLEPENGARAFSHILASAKKFDVRLGYIIAEKQTFAGAYNSTLSAGFIPARHNVAN